jgi:hypothetical protein
MTGARTSRPTQQRGYTAATILLRNPETGDLVVTIHDAPNEVTIAVYPWEPKPGDEPLNTMVVKRKGKA